MLSVGNRTTLRFQEATTAAQPFKSYWLSQVPGVLLSEFPILSKARLQPTVLAQSGISSKNGNFSPVNNPLRQELT
jgi:hypothetical protein